MLIQCIVIGIVVHPTTVTLPVNDASHTCPGGWPADSTPNEALSHHVHPHTPQAYHTTYTTSRVIVTCSPMEDTKCAQCTNPCYLCHLKPTSIIIKFPTVMLIQCIVIGIVVHPTPHHCDTPSERRLSHVPWRVAC